MPGTDENEHVGGVSPLSLATLLGLLAPPRFSALTLLLGSRRTIAG